MYEEALKQTIEGVAKGEYRRELYLLDNSVARELFLLELMDSANEAGLCPVFQKAQHSVLFDGHDKTRIVLAIAHPEISYRFAGMAWTAIHGLEVLDKYPDHAEGDKARLRAQIRPWIINAQTDE